MDIREKQKRLQNTVSKSDLRNRLEELHRSTWEEDKSSSQAKFSGALPKDRGGVGHHGGSQSSSHHRGSHQDSKETPPRSGPPRPRPSSTATSQSLGTPFSHARDQAKRNKSSTDQGRGSDEPNWRARDNKVRCLTVEVTRGVTVACSNSFEQHVQSVAAVFKI